MAERRCGVGIGALIVGGRDDPHVAVVLLVDDLDQIESDVTGQFQRRAVDKRPIVLIKQVAQPHDAPGVCLAVALAVRLGILDLESLVEQVVVEHGRIGLDPIVVPGRIAGLVLQAENPLALPVDDLVLRQDKGRLAAVARLIALRAIGVAQLKVVGQRVVPGDAVFFQQAGQVEQHRVEGGVLKAGVGDLEHVDRPGDGQRDTGRVEDVTAGGRHGQLARHAGCLGDACGRFRVELEGGCAGEDQGTGQQDDDRQDGVSAGEEAFQAQQQAGLLLADDGLLFFLAVEDEIRFLAVQATRHRLSPMIVPSGSSPRPERR